MKNVNIAFCFDKNLWKQFCVSVASLLVNSENKCHYNIYAIVSENITDTEKNYMKNVVSKYDEKSNITFLTDNHDFDILYKPAYFFRLQLLKLNNIDKIIYCDIDTLFNGNLVSLYDTNLGNNLFCGVKDGLNLRRRWEKYIKLVGKWFNVNRNKYINSGVMLINLKLCREKNIYQKVLKLITKIDKKILDQEIINYVGRGYIGFLPLKYNFKPKSVFHKYKLMVKENIFSRKEVEEAKSFAPVWHFMASNPWKVITKGANRWWKLCREFDFYEEMKTKFMKKANILQKLKFKAMEWNND